MPDEERVRTKRRKLDSIITKLHQAVPLGSEGLEEEENRKEVIKENADIVKSNEPLPGPSRRKLHRAAKQNQIDGNEHPQAKSQVTDDAVESNVTENGMEVDGEQEVCCNGEGNASNEIQAVCAPTVVKKERAENYENSLEGLQQMLGYSISEEVVNANKDASGKKKRLLSESSDADGHVVELPKRVECTACGRKVNPAHGTICRHPCLHVLVCKSMSVLPTKKITKVIKGDNKTKGSRVMVKYGDEELEATIIGLADDEAKLLHLDTEFAAANRHLLAGAVDSNSQSAPPTATQTNVEEQSKKPHDVQSTPPKSAGDPYLEFLSNQNKREKEWKTNQCEASETKLYLSTPPGPNDATMNATSDSITELRRQLAAKTEECSRLRIRLNNTEGALEKQQHNQESLFQMLEKIQASVSRLEDKVAVGFANLEERLGVVESQPVKPNKLLDATINTGCANETVDNNSELSEDNEDHVTINFDASNKLRKEDQLETSPVCLPPVQPTSTALKVDEQLIGTCVTPTKIKRVKQIMEKESERHLCALKLLPYFFSNEELATSNTDGSHEKKCLNTNKLNALKVLVFSKFPISSSIDKDKAWRLIKSKINSKCRAAKHLVQNNSAEH